MSQKYQRPSEDRLVLVSLTSAIAKDRTSSIGIPIDLPCPSDLLAEINSGFTRITNRGSSFPAANIRRRRSQNSRTFPPLGGTIRSCGPANRDTINALGHLIWTISFLSDMSLNARETSAGASIRIRLSIMSPLRRQPGEIDRRRERASDASEKCAAN